MILHMLSSAIQVSSPSPSEMVVYFPRQVFGSVFLFAIGLVLAIFMTGLIKHTGFKFQSLLFLLGFIPLIVATYIMTGSSTLRMSRSSHTLVLTEETLFIPRTTTYPLQDVDHVEIAEDDGHSHMFYLALASQNRIPVGGGWTPRNGYFQAADAVNVFLNKSRTPAEVTPAAADAGDYSPAGMEARGQRQIAAARAANKQAQH